MVSWPSARLRLTRAQRVKVAVYDVAGQEVASGVYLFRLVSEDVTVARKAVLIR